jgi:HEPN domain-containing protein
MTPDTAEWVEKAEGDLRVAERELAAPDPVLDAVCFHAQQCAEKYLKALLEENQVSPPRTHDLGLLTDACVPHAPELAALRPALQRLSEAAVVYRYPGPAATPAIAQASVTSAEQVRAAVRRHLDV